MASNFLEKWHFIYESEPWRYFNINLEIVANKSDILFVKKNHEDFLLWHLL